MSLVDPQLIHAEQHIEIGNLLVSNAGIILERWSRRAAQEQPNAPRVHHEILQDHLAELLHKIGRSLAETEEAHTSEHCVTAAKHGEQRWDAGWSLPEVVRDYQILRLIILEFLEEALDRPLRYREVLAVGLTLDEAIAASVVVYVQEREQYQKQLEENRINEVEANQRKLQENAAALQQADRRKNEFLAILRHELRNPLAPVRNALQILRIKSSPDPELQLAREIIERQAQQMTRMIDDLFDISRIAHGKIKIEKEAITIGVVFERAIEEVRPIMEVRKHRLTVAALPDPVWLEADGQRLTQVLVNLLINAAKFTEEAGQVALTAELEADHLVLRVRDSGIGIPPEMLPRIFEPFTQEEQTTDRSQSGLGIGLALVRTLIELHGGRVQAFSAGRGHGSEFVIHLPIAKDGGNPGAKSKQPAPPVGVTPRRVLVVDDNRDAANSLAMLLKLVGHDVQTAHDGASALSFISAQPPEIVLLDIGMPRMDGFEVARRIRTELGLTDVVLVALTGYGQEQDRRRSSAAGFDVHLVKPVELDHLRVILQKIAINTASGK